MKRIRAFIAIEPSPEVKSELKAIVDKLAQTVPAKSIRWVPVENIHLTLRFLGDTSADKLSAVAEKMDGVAGAHRQHDLFLTSLGCFPNRNRPRVLWVGLDGAISNLQEIHGRLSKELTEIGWEPERRSFHPHLTIGRVKDRRVKPLDNINWELPKAPTVFPVTELVLYESVLRPSGAIYHRRHSSVLGNP